MRAGVCYSKPNPSTSKFAKYKLFKRSICVYDLTPFTRCCGLRYSVYSLRLLAFLAAHNRKKGPPRLWRRRGQRRRRSPKKRKLDWRYLDRRCLMSKLKWKLTCQQTRAEPCHFAWESMRARFNVCNSMTYPWLFGGVLVLRGLFE